MAKRIVNILLAVYVLLLLAVAGPGLAGFHIYTVTSGSMEPAIPVASAIYVKEVPFENIHTGDIITYMINGDTAATHRVAEVHTADEAFITKGDANDTADAKPVSYTNVCGKVMFHIPYLGYGIALLQTGGGWLLLVSLGLLLFILDFLFSGGCREKEEQGKKEETGGAAGETAVTEGNRKEGKEGDICEGHTQ